MLLAVLKFARLRILVTCYAIALLGAAATEGITAQSLLIIFVIAAWYIHAASANDYADRDIDRINLKEALDRPLVARNITDKQLWIIHFTAGLLALVAASLYGYGAVLLTVGMLFLNYAYSLKPLRVSDRGMMSQLLLALAYVYYPLSLAYWSNDSTHFPLLLSIGLYIGFVGRLLLKDFRDVRGDKKYGKLTFVLRHGIRVTCLVSIALGTVAALILCFVVHFSPGALIILITGQILASAILVLLSRTPDKHTQLKLIALTAKIANTTLIILLIYFLCQNQPQLSQIELILLPLLPGLAMLFPVLSEYKAIERSKNA